MSPLKFDHDQAPTRAQRRERGRAQRLALQREQAAKELSRTRLTRLGLVTAVIVTGIVVVLVASGQGSSPKKILPQSAAARAASAQVSSLFRGIPQDGNVLGRPRAPVTIQYFADLQCPVCRSFSLGALPSVVSRWVRSGQLKIEYRSLETATREPEVFAEQQLAALAAGRQGRMWNFLETFYQEQQEEGTGYVTNGYIQGLAAQVPGLDLARWSRDRADPVFAERLAIDAQAASAAGLNGTPAFLIGRAGGTARRLEPSSFTDPRPFAEAIQAVIHG